MGINLLLIKTQSLDIFFTRTKLRALFHGAVRCKLSFLMYMLQGLNIPLDFSPFLLLFSSVPAAVQTFCATKLNIINMSVFISDYQLGWLWWCCTVFPSAERGPTCLWPLFLPMVDHVTAYLLALTWFPILTMNEINRQTIFVLALTKLLFVQRIWLFVIFMTIAMD